MNPKRIIISRTDSIGDVVLTLPLAGIIKQYYPDCHILFLGKTYTKDIIQLSSHVDQFIDWTNINILPINEQINTLNEYNADTIIHVFPDKLIAKLAKKANIETRIGTSHRSYHWFTCNKLINLSRKKSDLHEAQLNARLLSGLGITASFTLNELVGFYGLKAPDELSAEFKSLLDDQRINLILHTKSKGSAREWGLDNFQNLIKLLPQEQYKIFLSGTEEEGKLFRAQLLGQPNVVDISGRMSLKQFISFIYSADGLVAASTGPLHIAASLNKVALGIYPPIRPMHPGRWMPLGHHADYLVQDKECSDCRAGGGCSCMLNLSPLSVKEKLSKLFSENIRK